VKWRFLANQVQGALESSLPLRNMLKRKRPTNDFLDFLGILYPPNFGCWVEDGVFQQAIALTHGGVSTRTEIRRDAGTVPKLRRCGGVGEGG
jgi:hypothetical protein